MNRSSDKSAESGDVSLAAIVDFALSRRDATLGTRRAAILCLRMLDTFACALGGLGSKPSAIARAIASRAAPPAGCTMLGSPDRVSPESAIFANTVAVRYLDFNDHYPGSGHPSDMVPALLAAAEQAPVDGMSFLLALDTAYETATAIGDRHVLRGRGFDQGVHIAAGVAAGIGVMTRMSAEAMANAVAIAMTSTMPMRVTRTGEMSDWKGCATAAAARNGYLAARLAQSGLTGPPAPFKGIDGLERHIPPRGPLRVGQPGAGGLHAVERTNCKLYPTEGNSQAVLYALEQLHGQVPPAGIARLRIETYHRAWHEIGGGQGDRADKWAPRTRETADHSLPYLAALMLADGRIDLDSFAPARLRNAELLELMQRTEVVESADLTERYPAEMVSRIALTLIDGRVLRAETRPPPGERSNPLTNAQVDEKYDKMAAAVRPRDAAERLRRALVGLSTAPDLRSVTDCLAAIAPASSGTASEDTHCGIRVRSGISKRGYDHCK